MEPETTEIYELLLGSRLTLIALLEILEEKGVLKEDEVFARVLESLESQDRERKMPVASKIPFSGRA
jgi:SOS-response transcriptional repressor LexA